MAEGDVKLRQRLAELEGEVSNNSLTVPGRQSTQGSRRMFKKQTVPKQICLM